MDIKRASKSGRELWLIRIPVDLPTETLSDLKIELREAGGDGQVECDGRKFLASVSPAQETEAAQILALLPDPKESQLVAAKPFRRQLNLVEHIPGADAPSECPPLPPPIAQRASLPGKVTPSGHGFKGLPDSYASGGRVSAKKVKKEVKSPESKRKVKEEKDDKDELQKSPGKKSKKSKKSE
ncbi:hypothetical protein GUITHDRAFT_136727 [Guillardia theta CCMP2712]|uniref:Uncharacterized protein n=2 Tax=Guillardia theta TaxID=55529 RepID=L1JJX3_GUITC|nr:hypothetical protein GUITHDRAFT_136727 [Guillardia theta CCMP2712]EKX48642.1 hypothetical protein GUITHDRAFT_136727 [Guillardia theta CCMP2712]|eukprot:XP_005835622.1 hypothetical protein GUITHDRAFT_136727 [Guillardia theta CCMP2712]